MEVSLLNRKPNKEKKQDKISDTIRKDLNVFHSCTLAVSQMQTTSPVRLVPYFVSFRTTGDLVSNLICSFLTLNLSTAGSLFRLFRSSILAASLSSVVS